ncbi:sensor histidine kinase [Pedobacter boryungensis]|uniref:Histidine kinase n=1 Tax=Pedobacter boryungensis TaxID=869962 RepID=A0ABX2DDM7_9SPHI|nr:histidine kinase [Pedobacter boryungensis]NQX31076.1 histidine kinase [Pedobacter boryungensis]
MKKRLIIHLHIGYWLLVLTQILLVALGTGVMGTQFDWRLFLSIVLPVKVLQTACSALFFYVNYLLLVPYVLKEGSIIKYIGSLLGCILVFSPLYYLMEQIVYPLIGWKSYSMDLDFLFAFFVTLAANFLNIFLGLLLSYLMDWRSIRAEKEVVEKEQLKTELAFLKSQVNPHYLFNTINDIYSLTQQQSEEAPEALLKLSELLRYMLRESDDPYVPLINEIDYLNNVIDLQKIGQKGQSHINFKLVGEIGQQKIAPLILINFIENAFKHGVFKNSEEPIEILITVDRHNFHLHLRNKINMAKKDKTGGIGHVNVKRRLSLIYPNRHELLIDQQSDTFIVDLKIDLYD